MSDRRELLIIGTGGLAKEAAHLARQIDPERVRWPTIAYVAESRDQTGLVLPYGEVRYSDADLGALSVPIDVVIGIGMPGVRRRIAERLQAHSSLAFPNLIHPGTELRNEYVTLGRGNLIAKGVALTCDIRMGDFNLLNLNVTIGHDVRIGSFNVINPGANVSGGSTIGDTCLIGTGAQILETLDIASEIVVGAGSVVTRSLVLSGKVYVGVPAKLLE